MQNNHFAIIAIQSRSPCSALFLLLKIRSKYKLGAESNDKKALDSLRKIWYDKIMFELNFWMETLSWIGAITTLATYYLLSNQKIHCQSTTYQGISLVNNLFFTFYNVYKNSYSFAFLNVLFAMIAFQCLFRYPKENTATGLQNN